MLVAVAKALLSCDFALSMFSIIIVLLCDKIKETKNKKINSSMSFGTFCPEVCILNDAFSALAAE